jgi:Tol biopolymer transport system component
VLHQLTDEPDGVWDFQAAPDGQGILFSSIGPTGSTDLVLLASDGSRVVVLECPDERCISGQWQPGGPLIAFERIPLAEDANNTAEVWLLDTSNGALEPAIESNVLSETGVLGRENNSPRWSADGRYLALFHPDARVVLIRDLVGGSINLVPANLEIMGGWSPAAGRLSYSELAFGQELSIDPADPPGADSSTAIPSLYNHITVVDVDTELATDLSAGQKMDYGRPAWHPDGEALAVPRGTKGGAWQIWLLAVEGGDPQVLTNNPSMNHSSLAWSPAGQHLAFMGNDRGDSSTGPAVWLLDTDTGQVEMIIEGAYLPAWQP